MSDPVGSQPIAPSSSLESSDGVVTEAGRQMDPTPGRLSNTGRIGRLGNGLDMVNDNKDGSAVVPPDVVAAVSAIVSGAPIVPGPSIVSGPPTVSDSLKRPRSKSSSPPPSPQTRHTSIQLDQNRSSERLDNPLDASPATASGTAGPRAESTIQEVPPGPYQVASTGAMFYHPDHITHYRDPRYSGNFAGTALAGSRPMPPVATEDILQDDLMSVRELDSLATSVNAPHIFSGASGTVLGIEEFGRTMRVERQITSRAELRELRDAVQVGSHLIPIFVRPPRRVLLPGDPFPTRFSSAYFAIRRWRRLADDTESMDVNVATGDVGDALSPFGAAPPSDDAGSVSGDDTSLSSNADSHSDTDTVSGAGSLPGQTVPPTGEVVALPGDAGPLPTEVEFLPSEAVTLPGQTVPPAGEVVTLPGQAVPLTGQAGSELDDAGFLSDSISSCSTYADSVFSGGGGRFSDTDSHPDDGNAAPAIALPAIALPANVVPVNAVPANAVAAVGAVAGGPVAPAIGGGNEDHISFIWQFRDTI